MNKKILHLLEFCFFFTLFIFVFGISVNAYIDPSVATYVIQIGAGVVIAIGAIISIYFRKTKKKISEKLGIDENKNKEVESDDIFETKEEKPKKAKTKKK